MKKKLHSLLITEKETLLELESMWEEGDMGNYFMFLNQISFFVLATAPPMFQISHYAGICAKRLERIGLGGRLKPKRPTEEEIDQSR